jgi:hypothetical protein
MICLWLAYFLLLACNLLLWWLETLFLYTYSIGAVLAKYRVLAAYKCQEIADQSSHVTHNDSS